MARKPSQSLKKAPITLRPVPHDSAWDAQGETELTSAVIRDDLEKFTTLLRRPDIDVNAPNKEGQTPMHLAIKHPNMLFLQDLAAKDVHLEIPDNKEHTAMFEASQLCNANKIHILTLSHRRQIHARGTYTDREEIRKISEKEGPYR